MEDAPGFIFFMFLLVVLRLFLAALGGMYHARRAKRRALAPDDGLPLGIAAPKVHSTDLNGMGHQIGGTGRRQLLVFVSPASRMSRWVLRGLVKVAAEAGAEAFVLADLPPGEMTVPKGFDVGA